MISVLIPSRVDQYLQRTIDDLLQKAGGEIEIVVVLDGYDTTLRDDPRVRVFKQGQLHDNLGMREALNRGVEESKGEYLMKLDEHCMVDENFDLKLLEDMQDDWCVIPRRKRLDPEKWEIIRDGRPDIDYMYLAYPYERPYDRNCGLHGSEWKRPERTQLIDDTMSWQGSCWFVKKSHYLKLIHPLDTEKYGTFTQEAQEIGNKYWLSGGALKVNKKTWYAHYHKGNKGKGYGFSNAQYRKHEADKEKGRKYCISYWLSTQDYVHNFGWLLDKFWPVPTWPEDWKERIKLDEQKDWSKDPSKQPSQWL